MSPDSLYPTKNEAAALAALVPTHRRSFPVQDFLLQLVQFCQRDDVRSFLFNKEPFQVSYLANPHIAKNAVSGSLTSTKVENNATRYFSDHLRSLFFMLPVFASDNLSFGFGVHEHVFNPAALWDTLNPGIFGRSMSRFVRDDSLGVMVVLLDFPERDDILVDFTQLVGTTGQIHSVARFRRRELHAIYESGIFDMASLMRALESFQAAYEVRDCPVCGTRQQCDCDLPRVSPKHPFDINAFYANMERRLGTFQGVAGVTIYENGRLVHGTTVGSRWSITGGIDVNLIDRLQRWAICESALADDPRQSLIKYRDNAPPALLPNPVESIAGQPPMQGDLPFMDLDDDWWGNPGDTLVHVTARVIEDVTSQPENTEAPSLHDASEQRNPMVDVTDVSQGSMKAGRRESTAVGGTSSSGSRDASTVPSKGDSVDREVVKKLRAELRKERNRASAQRSNLRKKAESDAKKLEIKTNKDKASLLRAKEMMLRQENMRLRQQVAEQQPAKE